MSSSQLSLRVFTPLMFFRFSFNLIFWFTSRPFVWLNRFSLCPECGKRTMRFTTNHWTSYNGFKAHFIFYDLACCQCGHRISIPIGIEEWLTKKEGDFLFEYLLLVGIPIAYIISLLVLSPCWCLSVVKRLRGYASYYLPFFWLIIIDSRWRQGLKEILGFYGPYCWNCLKVMQWAGAKFSPLPTDDYIINEYRCPICKTVKFRSSSLPASTLNM